MVSFKLFLGCKILEFDKAFSNNNGVSDSILGDKLQLVVFKQTKVVRIETQFKHRKHFQCQKRFMQMFIV